MRVGVFWMDGVVWSWRSRFGDRGSFLGFGDLAGAVGLEEVVEGAELGLEVLGFVGVR